MSSNGGMRRVAVFMILALCFVSRTDEVESSRSKWGGKDKIGKTYKGRGLFVRNIRSDYALIQFLNSAIILIIRSWLWHADKEKSVDTIGTRNILWALT